MIRLLLQMEQSVRSETTVLAILGCFTGVDIRFWKALEGGGVRGGKLGIISTCPNAIACQLAW